jgi:hypothetical protein
VWKRSAICYVMDAVDENVGQTDDTEDVRQLRIEENLTSIGRAGEEIAISLSVTMVETMLRQHSFYSRRDQSSS